MDKQYKAEQFEDKIYQKWEEEKAFEPSNKGEAFSIIMPPPNANDPLHVGHAMFITIEDILIRFKRMQGFSALWLPGTDHAGIETQFVFEKKLKKKGKSRFDYDRETLYQMIWDYVEENSEVAIDQMKKLGASADWSRRKFTLDEDVVDLVLDTFIQLYEDGMIYRDNKLVNYCTKCGTAFSNLEVVHVEKKEPLYYMKYGPFTLATVRPETKFGDTAVAVHPKDKRYKKWVGKEVEVESLNGKFKLKVIADEYVDPEFGTGVVKITPAHDFNDFEVGKRHNLEVKQVIGFDGRLNEHCGEYAGLTVFSGRERVVHDLETRGLLEKVDSSYVHSVGCCYRCGKTIEPLPLPQFFIKVKPLAKKALKALDNKQVRVYGNGHDKILRHWLENLHDWNISRQIVWGIKIPVWYCIPKRSGLEAKASRTDLTPPQDACYVVSKEKPKKCSKCGSTKFVQEEDTFDTWFSSAQWPFATLQTTTFSGSSTNSSPLRSGLKGVPSRTDLNQTLFEKFYPTSVMETGYDILPFWVMRMLMMGIYRTGKVPFKKVYLHGMVRDGKGQKMSKSKGNVINPLDVVDKYGADALRMALVMGSTAGNDKSVGEETIRGMRNLTNKIWNAARFVVEFNKVTPSSSAVPTRHSAGPPVKESPSITTGLYPGDKQFKEELTKIVKDVTNQLESMKPGLAAEIVYNKFWHWFCDQKIEEAKEGKISYPVLLEGLRVFLKLLHPFVPFVTEAVWQEINKVPNSKSQSSEPLLITAKWPKCEV